MITKIKPDKEKADSLVKMAEITLSRLNKTNMAEYPSNSVVDFYDIIHKLIEALTLREGIKIRGEGAHQELIEYIAKTKKINEETRQFLQQMREYRNRIAYEGFMISQNYIDLNKEKIEKIIQHLLKQVSLN